MDTCSTCRWAHLRDGAVPVLECRRYPPGRTPVLPAPDLDQVEMDTAAALADPEPDEEWADAEEGEGLHLSLALLLPSTTDALRDAAAGHERWPSVAPSEWCGEHTPDP